ncbi:MAG: histidine kinase [Chloroflexi bacterium RBG_16_48_8]|nr:MAG: histidine kinase [Chloroflexi bacterium RBG_16_48_8]
MITIRHLLETKGYDIWSISPNATVYEAIQLLAEKDIGALIVMEGEKLVGVISERDYARKLKLKGKSSVDTKVSEVMSSNVITLGPDQTLEDCMAVMTQKHVRHLPIIDQGKVIGVVSIGDAVNATIANQEFLIEQLEKYIKQG